MSDGLVIAALVLWAVLPPLFIVGCVVVGRREDARRDRLARVEARERVRELEGAWALPAREPVR